MQKFCEISINRKVSENLMQCCYKVGGHEKVFRFLVLFVMMIMMMMIKTMMMIMMMIMMMMCV